MRFFGSVHLTIGLQYIISMISVCSAFDPLVRCTFLILYNSIILNNSVILL